MALTAASDSRTARRDRAAARFTMRVVRDWQALAAPLVDRCSAPTPFQNPGWLDAWYAAFAATPGIEPLIVIASEALTGDVAMVLPLIRRTQHGLRIVEFADLDVTDYNAPLLGRGAPTDAAGMAELWSELRTALLRMPGGADVIRLRKMPAEIAGAPNPLTLVGEVHPCLLNGNIVNIGDDYESWRYTISRAVRMELGRSWRVFQRDPNAAFNIVTDSAEAARVLDVMDVQQDARMQAIGSEFFLSETACAAFYRGLVNAGLGKYVCLTSLTSGDEIVATLLGVITGDRFVMIRISNAGKTWSHVSPGRLIIERTMAALHARGIRQFDFSVGNYDYKRRFGVEPLALLDFTQALSWRGWSLVARDGVARWLRNHPDMHDGLRRLLGKPPLHRKR